MERNERIVCDAVMNIQDAYESGKPFDKEWTSGDIWFRAVRIMNPIDSFFLYVRKEMEAKLDYDGELVRKVWGELFPAATPLAEEEISDLVTTALEAGLDDYVESDAYADGSASCEDLIEILIDRAEDVRLDLDEMKAGIRRLVKDYAESSGKPVLPEGETFYEIWVQEHPEMPREIGATDVIIRAVREPSIEEAEDFVRKAIEWVPGYVPRVKCVQEISAEEAWKQFNMTGYEGWAVFGK